MDEAAQILALLSESSFWEDESRGWSMSIVGGMSVGIDPKGSNWTWRVTRPDRSQWTSPQPFPSVQAAKNNLREELKRRREKLIDESTGPASQSKSFC